MQGDRSWNVAHRATNSPPSLTAVQRDEAEEHEAHEHAWRHLMGGAVAALEVPGLADEDRALISKVRRVCAVQLGRHLLTGVPS